jgi:hypothetical protein
MTPASVLKWWPPIGLDAMAGLGLAVGRGSTGVDDWFIQVGHAHEGIDRLLFFTDPLLLGVMLVAAVAIGLFQRRWRPAAAVALTPAIAVVAVCVLKRLFGREKQDALAYPSGHVTVMVAVLGMVVLVAGAQVWMLVSAVASHCSAWPDRHSPTILYRHDRAALRASALVCIAARASGLDGCQPRCDGGHGSG